MDNQARLFEGLGIPLQTMYQELPETVVITNLTRGPAYLEVVYDYEQCLVIPYGRSILCLCDPYLRRQLSEREGKSCEDGVKGFEMTRAYFDRKPNFDLLVGDRLGNRHILAIDRNHLPTLQDLAIASLDEETLEKLRKGKYGFLVRDHGTYTLNFKFHILDYEYDLYWDLDMIDVCPSCSCERQQRMRKVPDMF